ncbi:MAG: hypothetical protein EZS28_025451 [Streblomastix strix]|uniref:Uncharacterized protein n=1 Tax=Streblomastix strix TaxID=222440 RepID=A0A5J4V994_9EUKA|nr:MAG: hypothetical protein EZS28_025451 [Streblomastix strix]
MISTGMNKDKPSSQIQLFVNPTQKTAYRGGVRQKQMRIQREMKKLQTGQYLEQQEDCEHNNMDVDASDIQGTVGQPTGLQSSSGAQSPSLNAWLRLKDTGSISASNRDRTELQMGGSALKQHQLSAAQGVEN